MNKLISPSAPIRNSSYLPAIKDKENKYPDSTITMDQSRRCVNTYHVDEGKVYFPFYKLSSDGKKQDKSVYFDLNELRKLLKSNIDANSTQDIEPIPDKCINQSSSVISIISPTLKIYPTVSPSNLYTIRSSDNITPTAESINSTVDGSKPAVDNIDPTTGTITPTTDNSTPTTENITPATSNDTLTSQILVAPTVPPTINIVDDFLSATAASTSIGRLRNDLVKLQQAYPQANIATLLAAVDETLAFYKFVSLITSLSFFIDTIKDAHPEAAGYYKNQLKTLLSTINQHYDKKSTSDRTKRAPWQFSEVLSNLVKFESAPMKAEMLSFFKGFEETRVELINAVNSGFSVSPELRTLIDTLQSSDENIVNLMRQINKETADLPGR